MATKVRFVDGSEKDTRVNLIKDLKVLRYRARRGFFLELID